MHDVGAEFIYGLKYLTENRGHVKDGPHLLTRVTHETWQESARLFTEVIEPKHRARSSRRVARAV